MEVISDLETRFPAEFRATRGHRFRALNDLALRILYAYTGLACGQLQAVLLDWNSPDFLFVRLRDDLEWTQRTLEPPGARPTQVPLCQRRRCLGGPRSAAALPLERGHGPVLASTLAVRAELN